MCLTLTDILVREGSSQSFSKLQQFGVQVKCSAVLITVLLLPDFFFTVAAVGFRGLINV